jgi:acid stress-induced BolA-like protein IbaG/YrbA
MTTEEIKQRIETAIPGSSAYVLDPMNDGAHLQAFVISPAFEGMPVFKQQQMVMAAIKDIFEIVHALGLKTFTPGKWSETKSQYGF